jgi:hypothetical protein
MPPLSPKTITRLDPAVPVLWRDGETLQLGVDGEIRLHADSTWVEPLLTRMAAGFRMSSFDVIAHGVGAPRQEARKLLDRLRPLLVDDLEVASAVWVESIDLGDARCEYRMREALNDEGVRRGDRSAPSDIGVVLIEGAAAALQFARYLREDTRHLPVSFERGRMTVGPVVLPGVSPCLACRDLHERDRDPAWPRMHAQLIGRSAGAIGAARIAEAAALVARLLAERQSPGGFVEVSESRGRVWRSVTFHEECRCRDLSSRSPRGTGTVPVPLALPSAPTTPPAYARPA